MKSSEERIQRRIEKERTEVLHQLERWLELPMVILGFVWLGLLVLEFAWGLNPFLRTASTVIWIIFILDFLLKFSLAPRKIKYVRRSWLTAVSLALPALRIFRVARAVRLLRLARTTRGLRLVRVLTSINRGMKALSTSMQRRGFGYAVALTAIIMLGGAAGMHAFEGTGLNTYGEALWWTAMVLTSIGSEYWPQTAEGRILCVLLSVYGVGIFGYVTATLASFFIEQDAENETTDVPGNQSIRQLRSEIVQLRTEIRALRQDENR